MPFRVFEKREQAVAAHVEKVVENILVRRRSDPMRRRRVGRGRRRAQTVNERHAEHADVKVERHPHVRRIEGEMMNAAEQRLDPRRRGLRLPLFRSCCSGSPLTKLAPLMPRNKGADDLHP